jgi:hypothetical protein
MVAELQRLSVTWNRRDFDGRLPQVVARSLEETASHRKACEDRPLIRQVTYCSYPAHTPNLVCFAPRQRVAWATRHVPHGMVVGERPLGQERYLPLTLPSPARGEGSSSA